MDTQKNSQTIATGKGNQLVTLFSLFKKEKELVAESSYFICEMNTAYVQQLSNAIDAPLNNQAAYTLVKQWYKFSNQFYTDTRLQKDFSFFQSNSFAFWESYTLADACITLYDYCYYYLLNKPVMAQEAVAWFNQFIIFIETSAKEQMLLKYEPLSPEFRNLAEAIEIRQHRHCLMLLENKLAVPKLMVDAVIQN